MKVNFKQPRSIGGVDYRKGIHELPDDLAKHWYLLACLQNGTASIVEAPGAKKASLLKSSEESQIKNPVVHNYHEYMEKWESKEEKELEVISDKDTVKSKKRVEAGKKAAETRARNKANSKADEVV